MAASKTCILISSCEKYRQLAVWTADRVDRLWEEHPPIFFSGLASGGPGFLRHEGDPRDWMRVTLGAVETLQQNGFSHTYLILDDIPPMARCHADFLNRVLPGCAAQAGASLISLLGWGQHRNREGDVQILNGVALEQVPAANRWRFSLHPGLWNLADLREILILRCEQFAPGEHTPWNFERHHDSDFGQISERILNSCYRIRGRSHVEDRNFGKADLLQIGGCFVIDVFLFLARVTRGNAARAEAASRWLWAYSLYRGPYPLFWSGVMRQGKESPEWRKFTAFFSAAEVSREWKSLREKVIS